MAQRKEGPFRIDFESINILPKDPKKKRYNN
jgi:hypothetical protein